MADQKISQLTAASTPLAGTEVLPIVQSSTTKKVSVADLTAGRAISASGVGIGTSTLPSGRKLVVDTGSVRLSDNYNLEWGGSGVGAYGNSVSNTLTFFTGSATRLTVASDVTVATGNLVIGTSGKGIDFSATAGTGTSELLNDYETGTWSPTGGNLTVGNGTFAGRYTKIGDVVYLYAQLVFGTTTSLAGTLYPVSNLPYAAAAGQEAVGGLTYTNPGSNQYMGSVIAQGTNLFINFYALAGSVITPSGFSTTSPFTWGVDDIISFSIVYNAA